MSFFGLYLVGMNVFIGTRLFRHLLRSAQQDIGVEYASAYSIWPGRIHVEGLEIRGADHVVEWVLEMEKCDFEVSPTRLLRRHFLARDVHGSGLSFRLRLKFSEASPDHIAALPSLPGFGPLPLRAPGAGPAPPTDAQYRLWTIELEGVDARQVREIWIDEFRFTGDLRVRGRWLYRPLRWLEVGPTSIEGLREVHRASEVLLADGREAIDVTIHPVGIRPEAPDVAKMLIEHLSVDGALSGELRLSSILSQVANDGVRLDPSSAPLHATLAVDHGTLRAGTAFDWGPADAGVRADAGSIRGRLRLKLRVDDGASPRAVLSADTRSLEIRRRDARAQIALASWTITSHDLAVTHVFPDATLSADVRRLSSPALAPWSDLVRLPFRLREGALDADVLVEGSLANKTGRAEVWCDVTGLVASHARERFKGTVTGHIRIGDADLAAGRFELGPSQVDVDAARADTPGWHVAAPDLSARVESLVFADGTLREAQGTFVVPHGEVWGAAGRGDARLWGHVVGHRVPAGGLDLSSSEVQLQDVRSCASGTQACVQAARLGVRASRLRFTDRGVTGEISIGLPRAVVTDASGFVPQTAWPGGTTVRGGSGTAQAHLVVYLAPLSIDGKATLEIRDLEATAPSGTAVGDLSLETVARRTPGGTDLSGTELTVHAAGGGKTWWGRLDLPRATIRSNAGPDLKAVVHLTSKDADPFIAFLTATTSLPQWLANIPPTTGLEGYAELHVSRSTFEIQSATARAGSLGVRAAFARDTLDTDGAVLVQLGSVRAAFGLGDAGRGFVLFGAEPWFDEVAERLYDPTADPASDVR